MVIPSYAGSMVSNYRNMFKERYKRSSSLTDDQIWHICNTVHDDSSTEKCDNARIDEMIDLESRR